MLPSLAPHPSFPPVSLATITQNKLALTPCEVRAVFRTDNPFHLYLSGIHLSLTLTFQWTGNERMWKVDSIKASNRNRKTFPEIPNRLGLPFLSAGCKVPSSPSCPACWEIQRVSWSHSVERGRLCIRTTAICPATFIAFASLSPKTLQLYIFTSITEPRLEPP